MICHKLLCILHLPPPVHGAANIGQIINRSELINKSFNCDYINLTIARSLKDLDTFKFNKLFTILRLYYKVILSLIKERYDLCYFTINSSGPSFYKELLIVLILKCFGQQIVYHYHNKGISENQSGFIKKLLYCFQFKNQRVILLSPHLYYDVKNFVPENRVYYCANGIPDYPSAINDIKKQYNIPRLMFLSSMFMSKGVFLLLESCKILTNKSIKFECHFVGSWTSEISEKIFYEKCRESQLTDFVIAHGEKLDYEKDIFFAESRIFIFPTFYAKECFPLVILEAMKWGLPVISTDEGAIKEIVEDGVTGFVIQKNDPIILADRIETLLKNDTLLKSMGQNGRNKFEKLYTLEKFEHNFIRTLNQILVDFNVERRCN